LRNNSSANVVARKLLPQRRKGAKEDTKGASAPLGGFLCAFAPLREKFFIKTSKRELQCRMEHAAPATDCKRNRGIAHGRLIEIEPFVVPAHHFVLPWKPIHTRTQVPRVPKLSVYSRCPRVELECLRNHHRRSLYLKSMIE